MFTASLFTMIKKWKEPYCPSTDDWLQMWYIHIYSTHNGILLSHKKNKISLFAATWMNLENIMLSETSQRKTNTCMI